MCQIFVYIYLRQLPDIITVALVVIAGVGFDVADVNVYVEQAPPWSFIVSLVTSIVDDVFKFNPC